MDSLVSETAPGPASLIRSGTPAERLALRVLQAGALLVVLAVVTDRSYELDRFFVPKELVLHLTALAAGLLSIAAVRRVRLTWVDGCLVGYLLLGVVSTVLAPDGDLAARALTLSASGVAVYWVSRALAEAGLSRALTVALALAVVAGALTALLQVYGVQTDFFSVNRAPGGTLGNRNFVAHTAAFGLPIALLSALRAWRAAGYAIASVGVVFLAASLVLTRSRAGWLAFGVVIVVLLGSMLLSAPLRRHRRSWGRLGGIVLLAAGGVAAALILPNSLRWRSENPYLESVAGIVNYQEGSGAGRLVQYRRSLRMAVDRPLVGVGPGNWAIVYPDYAAPGDPSLSRSNPGRTANPWPSSDWVAVIAERGFLAVALLGLAVLGLATAALRGVLRARDEDEALTAAARLATILATVVAGLFDAVLLLALPTLVVWAAVGALSPREAVSPGRWGARLTPVLLVVLALAAGFGAVRSVGKLSTMQIVSAISPPSGLAFAGRHGDAPPQPPAPGR